MTTKLTNDSLSLESQTTMRRDFVNKLKEKPPQRIGRKNNGKFMQDWQNEMLELIETFLKCEEFDVNFYDDEISRSPLWQATMRLETFNKILERKTTDTNLSDPKGRTAIFLAVESQQLETIKLLRKAGADIERRDSGRLTPLSRAVELGHLETVRFLVGQENAKTNPDDGLDPTPLQKAVSIGSTDIVQYLLANAANVNHRDEDDRTPLLMAVSLGFEARKEIVGLLIERDADLNLADSKGVTPLITAVYQRDIESVRQILELKHVTVDVNQYV
ncbi:uncharacterized protein N7511_007723 [Penicillium nucicola]|uniref:uncharacterized protein n=1 Tax=Penicillium nucicola TaxID=1850975 RepID=UPI002544E0B9|nr:uncharacterized protein N7511_007723 [Penicillium nucicola]KAJ5753570.1 hypothetical protein N7511_007723 [Penicillium nucicola]